MLTDRDRLILELESSWWKHAGAKEAAVHAQFGISLTRYYQLVNALLEMPAAEAEFPLVVRRLRRLRDVRRRGSFCVMDARAEHVWVTDMPTRLPGILLGWRQVESGWQGWVITAEVLPSGEVEVRQRWVRAESIVRA